MDLTTLIGMVADLFLTYTFGDVWLGGLFAIFIMVFIGWKMSLSADGWVILMGGVGILFGTYYFSGLGMLVITLIVLGFLVYFLLKRLLRIY